MFKKEKDKEKDLTSLADTVIPFGERKLGILLALIFGLVIGNKAMPKLIHILYWITIVVFAVLWISGTPVPFK